jgi:hypothetical protein
MSMTEQMVALVVGVVRVNLVAQEMVWGEQATHHLQTHLKETMVVRLTITMAQTVKVVAVEVVLEPLDKMEIPRPIPPVLVVTELHPL